MPHLRVFALVPPLLCSALAGCSNWIDTTPSCKLDVYNWSDDLLAHILTGPGDGTFDYDPEDVPRRGLKGKYDYETGDFSWSVSYGDAYWLKSTEVEGYGTAYHNGNLDILYTEVETDILDEVVSTTWRVTRTGCSVEREGVSEGAAAGIVQVGEYQDDDSYSWEGEYGDYRYFGGMRQNLSRTVGIESADGSYVQAGTYKPEGTADISWAGSCGAGGYTCDVEEHQRFDGGIDQTATIFDRAGEAYATVEANFAYDGAGVAHYDYADGGSCDYSYASDGECTLACSDGTDGSC